MYLEGELIVMKVLAIGAHPDDCEVFCGGTLAKYSARGDKVVMVSVTNGEIGSRNLPAEEISAIRRKEGEAAAKVIGAEYIWMGYKDQHFIITEEARCDFIDLIRSVQPDVIFTHYPDLLFVSDHTLIGLLVNEAVPKTVTPNFKTKNPSIEKVPSVYFWDTLAGIKFQPEDYVDITDFMKTKLKMVYCHKSQDEWTSFHTGGKSGGVFGNTELLSRFRGMQCMAEYAEGFIKAKNMGRLRAGTLLP